MACNHVRAIKLFIDSINSQCPYIGKTKITQTVSSGHNVYVFSAHQCPSYQHFLAGKCFSCKAGTGNCALMGYHADITPGLENEVSPQVKLNDLVGNKYFTTTGREFPYCRKFVKK